MIGISLKKILQGKTAFIRRKGLCRPRSHAKEWILCCPTRVILNLRNKRWNKIKSLMNFRKLIQQFHHPVVVFKRVQAHPGKTVCASDKIFVEGLVLVPKDDNAQNWHRWLDS